MHDLIDRLQATYAPDAASPSAPETTTPNPQDA
jgi:hypothetical protein